MENASTVEEMSEVLDALTRTSAMSSTVSFATTLLASM